MDTNIEEKDNAVKAKLASFFDSGRAFLKKEEDKQNKRKKSNAEKLFRDISAVTGASYNDAF